MGILVSREEEYVLTGEPPWQEFPDPDHHRALGGSASQQRDNDATFEARRHIYATQSNVKNAIKNALNDADPQDYRRVPGGGVGPKVYTATDNPWDIIKELQGRYG